MTSGEFSSESDEGIRGEHREINWRDKEPPVPKPRPDSFLHAHPDDTLITPAAGTHAKDIEPKPYVPRDEITPAAGDVPIAPNYLGEQSPPKRGKNE
jgi:hypothetical protein